MPQTIKYTKKDNTVKQKQTKATKVKTEAAKLMESIAANHQLLFILSHLCYN